MKKSLILSFALIGSLLWSLNISAKGKPELLTTFTPRPDAPNFILKDIDEVIYDLSKQKGKVIIINFWASWCPPCLKEMPSMQRAWNQVKHEGIVLWAINTGETEDDVFAFSAEVDIQFPLLLDESQEVTRQWAIRAMPTTYIVDKQGKVAYYAIGERQWNDPKIIQLLRDLNNESPNKTHKE